MEATLTPRTLNRAMLDRQMLLERSHLPLTAVVERMGGIQNQYAPAGYVGLWSRTRAFERPMLTEALEQRRLIQGTLMRGTIHVVSAADYWPMVASIARVNREWFSKVQASEIGDIDLDAVADTVKRELADGPVRFAELRARLTARGLPARAASWASFCVPMVRVPPSGTWDRRRADLYGLAAQWLPPVEVREEDGIELLIRRYLGAFGPAALKDIAGWMGLNVGQMRHVADRLVLLPFRDAAGRPLVDLPDATLPDPDTPAPPRFIAVWDAMLLVHARRTEILPEAYRPFVFSTKIPQSVNTFMLDGQVAGSWQFEGGEIQLSPFRPLSAGERSALDEEAHRLARFYA